MKECCWRTQLIPQIITKTYLAHWDISGEQVGSDIFSLTPSPKSLSLDQDNDRS